MEIHTVIMDLKNQHRKDRNSPQIDQIDVEIYCNFY